MESFLQDVRYGWRMLVKNPGFAAVAISTLALGIGANTAIFSVVNNVLLRPLTYREPQQLYLIREIIPSMSHLYPSLPANLPAWLLWQRECHSFEQIAVVEPTTKDLTGRGEAEQIRGAVSSANLFEALGIRPRLGRTFAPEEDQPGHDHVVIITDSFWRSHFGADPTIVGETITLDGAPYNVIGVLPPSFHFPKQLGTLIQFSSQTEFFKPLGVRGEEIGPFGDFDFAAVGRLKAGVSPSQALAEIQIVQSQLAREAGGNIDLRAELVPLEQQVVGAARQGLLLLLIAVGAVLLIVCINIANLLLSHLPGRMREAAVRTALGATRWRLFRLAVSESLVLGLIGGALGVLFAYLGVNWLVHAAPIDLPRLDEVRVDARVLWFAFALSILASLFFGAIPAWRLARGEPQEALKSGSLTTTEGRGALHLRESLIGFEVGLSTLLLIVAGLLTMSLYRLLRVHSGFEIEHVLTVNVDVPPHHYPDDAARTRFYDQALAQVQQLPGVKAAGWVSLLPLEGQLSVSSVSVANDSRPHWEKATANYRFISADYFRAIGIPLLAGRFLAGSDHGRSVALISRSLADHLWPGQDPIGRSIATTAGAKPLNEVIGVVGDIRTIGLDQPPVFMVYIPYWERARTPASLVIRSSTDPAALSASVRRAIQALDSEAAIARVRAMSDVVSQSVEARRFQMLLALLFAGGAISLAGLGIYGVVSYSVEQRRHELGIRMALGAQVSDLQRLVMKQGMWPVFVGLAAGLMAALSLASLLRHFLFGVSARNPITMLLVAITVAAISAAACFVPANRTSKLDPMVALRYE